MPILEREPDIHPENLFQDTTLLADSSSQWYCLYTMSRREKALMRAMRAADLAFYGPMIPKRNRSPQGRVRVSFVPLFANYVFLLGDEGDRVDALRTNCVSRTQRIEQVEELVADLRQIQQVIQSGVPLTPEGKLSPGNPVRVRSGPFKGYEGVVLRREGKTRLLLAVKFLEQGVSMEMDEGLLEPL